MAPDGNNPVFKGNGGALLFTTSETSPGSLSVSVTSVMSCFANGWSDDSTPIWNVDNQNDCANYDWWANQGCDFMTIAPNKKYGIKVNGSQFCDAWWKQNEVSSDAEMTMNVDNVLEIRGNHDYAITSNMSTLNIVVFGKTTISSIRFAATDQVTTGTLTISSGVSDFYPVNSLTLTNNKDQLAAISGFTSVNIEEPLVLKTPSEISEWDSYNGGVFMADYYGLTINGVDVISA